MIEAHGSYYRGRKGETGSCNFSRDCADRGDPSPDFSVSGFVADLPLDDERRKKSIELVQKFLASHPNATHDEVVSEINRELVTLGVNAHIAWEEKSRPDLTSGQVSLRPQVSGHHRLRWKRGNLSIEYPPCFGPEVRL